MNTDIDIVNAALTEIGSTAFITTLDDSSEEARVAKIQYPHCLRRALEKAKPSFALKTDTLDTPLENVTRKNWLYAFELPVDFLCMSGIVVEGTIYPVPEASIEYDIQSEYLDGSDTRILLTNLEEVEIEYVAHIETVSAFSAEFAEALVILLASKFMAALPKDRKKAQELEAQFRALISEASAELRNQRETQKLEPATPSLRARGGYVVDSAE